MRQLWLSTCVLALLGCGDGPVVYLDPPPEAQAGTSGADASAAGSSGTDTSDAGEVTLPDASEPPNDDTDEGSDEGGAGGAGDEGDEGDEDDQAENGECMTNADCGEDEPICGSDRDCVQCESDADCPSSSECEVEEGRCEGPESE